MTLSNIDLFAFDMRYGLRQGKRVEYVHVSRCFIWNVQLCKLGGGFC